MKAISPLGSYPKDSCKAIILIGFWIGKYLHDRIRINIFSLHWYFDFVNGILGIITITVILIIFFLFSNRKLCLFYIEIELIELAWTLAPSLILITLGVPSLGILYQREVFHEIPLLTIKIVAHQWYWSYDYSDFKNVEFDSFMLKGNRFKQGFFKYLEVDNRIIFPFDSLLRLIFTSRDVIHSWTVQNLGVKVDCIPGKLNQAFTKARFPGIFYGQCSEICGVNHSFIPIVVERTTSLAFINWLKQI